MTRLFYAGSDHGSPRTTVYIFIPYFVIINIKFTDDQHHSYSMGKYKEYNLGDEWLSDETSEWVSELVSE